MQKSKITVFIIISLLTIFCLSSIVLAEVSPDNKMDLTFKTVDTKRLSAAYGKVLSEQGSLLTMGSAYMGLFNDQKALREKVTQAYKEIKDKPDLVEKYYQIYNNFKQQHPTLASHLDTLTYGWTFDNVDRQIVQKEGYKPGEKYKWGALHDIKKFIGFSSDFPVNYFYTIDYKGTVSDKTNKLMKTFNIWYLFTYKPTNLTNLISTYLGIDVSKYPITLQDFYNKYLKGKDPSTWEGIVRKMIKEKQQRLYETRVAQQLLKNKFAKRVGNRIVLAQTQKTGNNMALSEIAFNVGGNNTNENLEIARLAYPPTLPKINASEIDFGQFTNDPNSQAYTRLDNLDDKKTTYYLLDKVYFLIQRVPSESERQKDKEEKDKEFTYKDKLQISLDFQKNPSYDAVIYNGAKQYSSATQKMYEMLNKYNLVPSSYGVPNLKTGTVQSIPSGIIKRVTDELYKKYDEIKKKNSNETLPVNYDLISVNGLNLTPTKAWILDYSSIKKLPMFAYIIKQLGGQNFLYNGFYPYGKFITNYDKKDKNIYNYYIIVTYKTLTVPKKLLTWVEYQQGDPIYQQKTIKKTITDANGKKQTVTETVFEIVDYKETPVLKQQYYDPLIQKAVAYKDRKGRTYYRIVNRTADEINNLSLGDINGTISGEQLLGYIFLQFVGAPGSGESKFKPFITSPDNY